MVYKQIVYKHFALWLGVRLIFLFLTSLALIYVILLPGYYATALVLCALAALQFTGLLLHIRRTNNELTRFLEACRYGDFSQRFNAAASGLGFADLGEAFNKILEDFSHRLSQREIESRQLKELVEHVPVPLLSVASQGQVVLHNHSARRLFGASPVTRLDDLKAFGEEFHRTISGLGPGERRLAAFATDQVEKTFTLAATQLSLDGRVEQLISLQDIQGELDVAQLKAWQDLVRVLTHEIMNSITPVASLAKTSLELVDYCVANSKDPRALEEGLADVREAVDTMVQRSDGLVKFIQSYRRLTRLPPARKQKLDALALVERVAQLSGANWPALGIKFKLSASGDRHLIQADPDMLEQVLINLFQNAEHALVGQPDAQIWVRLYLNRGGHHVIEVADNGPGISKELESKIFVPFFTTKQDGSGVGLALTRQIMIAHGGSIRVNEAPGGGAAFLLIF